jgi:hypothetical protein
MLVELVVLGLVAAGTGAAYLLRKRGKPQAAADVEIMREVLKLVAKAPLKRGEEAAVQWVMDTLGPKLNRYAAAHGVDLQHNAYMALIRAMVGSKIREAILKAQGK